MATPPAKHREALAAAIAGLPTADDESWTVPDAVLSAAGMSDDVVNARKFILQFSLWARSAIDRLPQFDAASMQATDFNDYYKIVMSRVQLLYATAVSGAELGGAAPTYPVCSFQTQLRRRPAYKKSGTVVQSGVFDLKGKLKPSNNIPIEGSLETSKAAFRAALAEAGARKFDAATLRALLGWRSAKAALIEESLTPLNDAWVGALDGKCLFTLLPEGADFSEGSDEVEVKLVVDRDGTAGMLAQGPWFRVTFCETPLLQTMSQFFTDVMNAEGDADGVAWCREAMMNFATTIHQAQRSKPGAFSLFAGRRTPHPTFHLLQHMYITECLGGMATSSLFAGRVLGAAGMPQALIGTLAHEGPMGLMALHTDLDENVPMSSLLWHVLFWAFTSNRTILPDGHGSAVFRAMLADTNLLDLVAMARQDSGSLARFAALFAKQNKMASEIEKWADVESAAASGFIAYGAGGFFGEKRRVVTPEFSLAAKLTKAIRETSPGSGEKVVGFSAKLGDCAEKECHYSWAEFPEDSKLPMKFIVSDDADRAEMWHKMLEYAAKGDRWWDAQSGEGGGSEVGGMGLTGKEDALRLARLLRSLLASPALSSAALQPMAERLKGYTETIEKAAEALA